MSDETEHTGDTVYRWTCPACGATNRGFAREKDALASALEALRSHIRVSADADHGPGYEIPDKWSEDTLESHVETDGT